MMESMVVGNRRLVFNGREGLAPPHGTDAFHFALLVIGDEPEEEEFYPFCDMPEREFDRMIAQLRRLGWGFCWVTLH